MHACSLSLTSNDVYYSSSFFLPAVSLLIFPSLLHHVSLWILATLGIFTARFLLSEKTKRAQVPEMLKENKSC